MAFVIKYRNETYWLLKRCSNITRDLCSVSNLGESIKGQEVFKSPKKLAVRRKKSYSHYGWRAAIPHRISSRSLPHFFFRISCFYVLIHGNSIYFIVSFIHGNKICFIVSSIFSAFQDYTLISASSIDYIINDLTWKLKKKRNLIESSIKLNVHSYINHVPKTKVHS